MLTGDAGTAYGLSATFEMEKQEQGMYRNMGYFSRGYQDLTGLCMRLAFADAMYRNEKPFLILDDPFVNLDEEKIERGRVFVREVAKEYQVIYFTCHENRA